MNEIEHQCNEMNEMNEINSAIFRTCRICLENYDHDDLFLSPCKCSGSTSFVHLSCLYTWLCELRLNNRELNCDICKEPYNEILMSFMNHYEKTFLNLEITPKSIFIVELLKLTISLIYYTSVLGSLLTIYFITLYLCVLYYYRITVFVINFYH